MPSGDSSVSLFIRARVYHGGKTQQRMDPLHRLLVRRAVWLE